MGVILKFSPRKTAWQALQRMLNTGGSTSCALLPSLFTFLLPSQKTLTRDATESTIKLEQLPCPGARLPTEILIPIFEEVKKIWEPFFFSTSDLSLSERLGWITVSHVCQRWRAIVLDMPSLWTHVPLLPGGWPQEFLCRSRDRNLRHVVFFSTSGMQKRRRQRHHIKQLAANAHRLESLHLRGDVVYRFLEHGAGPAPHLWNLFLSTRDSSGASSTQRRFVMPSSAFAGVVPALRVLTLEDVPVHPDSPLLAANLTHLELSRGGIFHESPCPRFLSLLDLLAALRRMPNLCSLEANDILTEPESVVALETRLDALQTVWLPQLQTIKIHSPWIQNYRGFVRMVEYDYVPEQWDMGTTFISLEGHHLALLPYDVTTFSVPGEVPPLASLRLRSWNAHEVTVEGWRTLDVEGPLGWGLSSFSAKLCLLDARACDGADFLCAELPLHTVEKLALDWRAWGSDQEGNPSSWVPLLQRFAGVRCLQTDEYTPPEEIIAALAWTGTDAAGDTVVLCPGLCELRICYCYMPPKGQREQGGTGQTLFESLASALEMRARHGSALQRLVVKDKPIPCAEPGDLGALRRMQSDRFSLSGAKLVELKIN